MLSFHSVHETEMGQMRSAEQKEEEEEVMGGGGTHRKRGRTKSVRRCDVTASSGTQVETRRKKLVGKRLFQMLKPEMLSIYRDTTQLQTFDD